MYLDMGDIVEQERRRYNWLGFIWYSMGGRGVLANLCNVIRARYLIDNASALCSRVLHAIPRPVLDKSFRKTVEHCA